MRIAIVTDAWHPQVNGVVRTLSTTAEWLERLGHEATVVSPEGLPSIPCPTYPEIRLSLRAGRAVAGRLAALKPDAIHISTEGPLGLAARSWCLEHGQPFTTAYHTQFPEYLRARLPVPLRASYAWLRRFHAPAVRTLVSTQSMRRALAARGFRHLAQWGRGVDCDLFRPQDKTWLDLPRPVSVFVGRLAVEKGIEEFLALDLPGTQMVIGDGPAREALEQRYPQAMFTGCLHGEALARHIAASDVMVFPSRTDTFGLVMLEALACGVPVAAYPVTGPVDVIEQQVTGVLNDDLRLATLTALQLDPATCRTAALRRSWEACTLQFLRALACEESEWTGTDYGYP